MTQSHVLILQHVPWEKPGRILDSLDDLGMSYEVMNIAKEKKPDLPNFSDVSGIVIMGGPMGALDTDKYPGLKAESKLVRAAVSVGKPLLGVCLGHQIIATALGAKLKKGSEPEIGFAPIKRIDKHDYFSMWNKTLDVLHWCPCRKAHSRWPKARRRRTRRSGSVRRLACNSTWRSPPRCWTSGWTIRAW